LWATALEYVTAICTVLRIALFAAKHVDALEMVITWKASGTNNNLTVPVSETWSGGSAIVLV
jgi:hypothetical protein